MSKKNIVAFYHDNCLDGFASAYVAWKYYHNCADVEFRAIPINYGDTEAEVIRTLVESSDIVNIMEVMFLDFCPETQHMDRLLDISWASVVVLDHHKSRENLMTLYASGVGAYNRIIARYAADMSGVGLAWEWFMSRQDDSDELVEPLPLVLAHVQDRDLWKFELPDTKAVYEALYAKGMNPWSFEHWDFLVRGGSEELAALIKEGALLLVYKEERYAHYASIAYSITLFSKDDDGCRVSTHGLAVNAPYEFASEVGHRLATASGTFGLVWSYDGKDDKVRCSIRSENMNIIPIAQYYDGSGGGHAKAAGFSLALDGLSHIHANS